MPNFSVINNLNSLRAKNYSNSSINKLNKSINILSSGNRINQAGDDAAGLAVANLLNADSTALSQGIVNANNGIGYTQIVDGSLEKMGNMLGRAVELATQSASGTIGESERKTMNEEYQQILQEIDRMSDSTHFNGKKLFSGEGNANIFVGDTQKQSQIDISISGNQGINSDSLGLKGTSMLTAEEATALMPKLNDAINKLSQSRGVVGAQQNGLQNSISTILEQRDRLIGAESTIRDANIAQEVSNFISSKILTESSMFSIIQANDINTSVVLNLFK